MYKRITYYDRIKIETLYNRKVSVTDIAKYIGKTRQAIYEELKKGYYQHKNTDWTETKKYSAYKAQRKTEYQNTAKGAPLKIGKRHDYVTIVETLIVKEQLSPYACLQRIKSNKLSDISVCKTTLYSYISKGIFPHITNKNLWYKSKEKKKHKTVRTAKRMPFGESIEKRSQDISDKIIKGHFEIDTVIGKKRKR